MKYYVYIYLDQTKPGNFNYSIKSTYLSFRYEPFYVGMARRENRLTEHLKETESNAYNKHKVRRISKIKNITNNNPIIIKLLKNLSKENAKTLETEIIKTIGRRNLLTGPLTNLTDGGDGTYGYKPTNKAKENWKSSIKKFYDNPDNRRKAGYYTTLEGFIERYGKELGTKKYIERIEKMKKSVRKTYEDKSIREKCANCGSKNGMYGTIGPTAKRVIVYGKIYNSVYEASVENKIPYTTLHQRLRSRNFSDFNFVKN